MEETVDSEELHEQIRSAVQEAMDRHEVMCREHVMDVVKAVLAEGDFMLPDGKSPDTLLGQHDALHDSQQRLEVGQRELRDSHAHLDRNVDRILDVVVGPVKEDFFGEPHPDGERDESNGLMARTEVALAATEKLDDHLSNGGVPVKLPTSIKAAIWGAAATVIGSTLTAAALIAAAVLS